MDINDQLGEAEFAFIGRPRAEVPGGQEHGPRQFLFEVEVWVKGNLGTPVMVHGFEWSAPEIGQRMAMILRTSQEGVLYQPECVGTSPETLLAIAAAEAEAASAEPAAILIGGAFGAGRVMALDALARLVGIGPGEGAVAAMAACPDGRRTVEVVSEFMHGLPAIVAVRDTASLGIVREAGLPGTEESLIWPQALSCRDEDGEDVLLGLPGIGIGRLDQSFELLHAGSFIAVAIGRQLAVVMERLPQAGEDGYAVALDVLDLESGKRVALHEPSRATEPISFALSPDESRLAFMERMPYGSDDEGVLVHVYDIASPSPIGSYPLPAPRFCDSCWGDLAWLDDATLLVRDRRWDENGEHPIASVRALRLPDLEVVEQWAGGLGNVGEVAGEVLLTIDDSAGAQRLFATSMDGGEPVELRILPTHNAAAMLLVHEFDAQDVAALLGQAATSPPPASPPSNSSAPQPSSNAPAPSDDVSSSAVWLPLGLAGLGVIAVLLVGGLLVRRRPAG